MPFHGLQDLVWVLPEAGPGLYLSLHQAGGRPGGSTGWGGWAQQDQGSGMLKAVGGFIVLGSPLAVNPGGPPA